MIRKIDKSIKYKPISRYKLGYIIAWDFKYYVNQEFDDEGNIVATHTSDIVSTWMIEYFDTKPTIEQIKELIANYYGEGFDADKFDWKPYENELQEQQAMNNATR